MCYNNLGLAWRDLGDGEKAIAYFEDALTIYKKLYNREHPSIAICYNNLGLAWHDLGDGEKAIAYFEDALTITKKLYNREHPDVAMCYNNLESARKQLDDARTCSCFDLLKTCCFVLLISLLWIIVNYGVAPEYSVLLHRKQEL